MPINRYLNIGMQALGNGASHGRGDQFLLRRFTPQKIEAVARVLNKRFSTSTPFSRAYLKATVNEIRITGDVLKIKGCNRTMADLVAANGIISGENQVLRFIPEWRPLIDAVRTRLNHNLPNLDKILPASLS